VRVIISPDAYADMREIGDWVRRESPRQATRIVRAFQRACLALGRNPSRYQLAPPFEHLGILRRIEGPYLIFYRIEEDAVHVLRVVHGARDYPTFLFQNP
jgi:toxin ParE1/3/4